MGEQLRIDAPPPEERSAPTDEIPFDTDEGLVARIDRIDQALAQGRRELADLRRTLAPRA
jgi:hypothetical protein